MSWLIRLYPPAWRRRYGRELAELPATQPASFGTAIDLVAGAIDAWLNPQSSTAAMATDPKETGGIPEMLQLRGFGHRVEPTAADSLKAAGVTIGGTLAVVLAVFLAKARYGENPYLESLALVAWLVPFLFGLTYTEMKGRSVWVRAVFVGVPSAIVIAIALVAA